MPVMKWLRRKKESSIHIIAPREASAEGHICWKCTKCNVIFLQKNIARLHLRVRHASTFKLFASRAEEIERSIEPFPRAATHGVYEVYSAHPTPFRPLTCMLRKYTSSVMARRAYGLGRLKDNVASTSYRVLEALTNDGNSPPQSLSPTVEHLLLAAQHRRSVLHLASTLGRADPEFMAALTRDEEHIMGLLESMSDNDKGEVIRLRGPIAADLLNLLDLPSEEYMPTWMLHPSPPAASDIFPFKANLSEHGAELERSLRHIFAKYLASSRTGYCYRTYA
ncbi:uncharacterized protein PHACADRAFT_188692 [Phanerochaete carnosa HHB-10118-sp]|uniref:C2H2-type domain-containing protein n=1 Tax=Phanerochaete carnosa (strain HHB-10118-sp) TaxID=650164 RepID=K5VEM6_PHACS|nr:uncharacterized protein PHACADRAFT_188692 [Phanerochaete carnosa HHB-10118-sp]EKM49618.1 hypothetical protein PHACADRAFT_188692 [Phanerochaete carnosa HHB-10118-sp]